MSIRLTAVEYKQFFEDTDYWKDLYIDYTCYRVNGGPEVDDVDAALLNPADIITVVSGEVYEPIEATCVTQLVPFVRKWKKAQTTTTLVISFPKEKEEMLRNLLKNLQVTVK